MKIPYTRLLVFFFILSYLFTPQILLADVPLKERNILAAKGKEINLSQMLVTDNSWNKLSGYKDRAFWESVSPVIRAEYIADAVKYLKYDWPAVKATDYLEVVRSGDRRQEAYAGPSNALISLVMGELIEGKGRFIDQIINGVWYYSEQTWWGWSAHLNYFPKHMDGLPDINYPTVDLGVGEVSCNLAWTLHLFKDEFDKVHPEIAKRVKQEVMRKAIIPYYEHDDFRYMGFTGTRVNNWNPWINYNMLNCVMLLEEDPIKKKAGVQKIVNSLDKFLNGYSDDGGCDEGPSYWGAAGAMLFEDLENLKNATNGKFEVFNNPLIQNIGNYFYKVNIHAPYFINFADADAKTGGNPASVYRYGMAIHDVKMQQFGAFLAKLNNWGEHSFTGKICDQIRNLGLMKEILSADAKEIFVADFWLPDTEVAGARDKEGTYNGFFFGAKGGFNAESHNHNDIGSCVMYYDGKPCLIDLGRESYTAKTFSSRRYEIWTMQSQYHNLPKINGVDQKDGAEFKAANTNFVADNTKAFFSTDIAGAYPDEAKVKSWVRSYTLKRGQSFTITDKFELKEKKEGVTSSNLMTYCKVSQVSPGLLKFEGDGFAMNMSYNPKVVNPKIEFIPVKDTGLKRYWPNGVTRIVMEFIKPTLKGGQEVSFTPAK
jgi:Heparinase II/III-like protein